MAQLVAAMELIPDCVKNSTIQHIEQSGCLDIKCMCQNNNLLQVLVYDLLRRCEPRDQNQGIEVAQQVCVSVIPSLNDSRQTQIVAVVAVMTVVSTIAVILRLISRKISAAPYGADDFLIIVALVLTYGLNINEIIAVHYGFGRHQLMLSLDYISKFLLNDWTIQILFASAISITRLSLLVFYHRIFPVKRFRIVASITGCIMICWWISFIFAIIFSCYPVTSYWDKAIVGHCVNEHTLSWGITGTELATNIIMLVLPIPWLWKLRLDLSKKLALIGIFALGTFVCISCIVRFPLLATLVQTDASWTIVPAGIWIVVECNIGIASVCLPLMRPLVSFKFSTLSSYFSHSKSPRSGYPTTDEENSTGIRSNGKPCEKPYDGPSLEIQHNHGSRPNRHHISHQMNRPSHHPSKPRRSHKEVRTHRSRIESYSPEKYDPLRAHPPKPTRRSAPPTFEPRKARRNTYRLSKDEMSERYRKWYQGRGSEVGRGYWSLQITPPGGRKGLRGSELPWEVGDHSNRHRPPPKSRL